jgi:hypothetical protein
MEQCLADSAVAPRLQQGLFGLARTAKSASCRLGSLPHLSSRCLQEVRQLGLRVLFLPQLSTTLAGSLAWLPHTSLVQLQTLA